MRIKGKSIAVAILVLVFLTVLPFIAPSFLPSEFYYAITRQAGVNIEDFLNRLAVIGIAAATLILLRGLQIEKNSQEGLALSIMWKLFLLVVVIFILSIGKVETLGLAILSSESSSSLNMVTFDFRLITFLTAVIVTLLIIRSVLEYKETMNLQS